MISQRVANLVFAAISLVAAACMGWIAWGFETPPLGDATLPTKFFPLILVGFVAVSTVVYAIEYILLGQSGGDEKEVLFEGWPEARRGLSTLTVTCISYFIWQEFGFMYAGLFATPAIALAMGTRNLWHFGIIFIGAGLTYLVFTYGLGTQFR